MAIFIQDRVNEDKEHNINIVKKFKKNIEKLQMAHFERMMPKQVG